MRLTTVSSRDPLHMNSRVAREAVNECHGQSAAAPVRGGKSCLVSHDRAPHHCHVEAGHSGSGTVNPTPSPHVLR